MNPIIKDNDVFICKRNIYGIEITNDKMIKKMSIYMDSTQLKDKDKMRIFFKKGGSYPVRAIGRTIVVPSEAKYNVHFFSKDGDEHDLYFWSCFMTKQTERKFKIMRLLKSVGK